MPSRSGNNNNQKPKITSDNNTELELIKIDVERVMKDIDTISTFTQKKMNIVYSELNKTMSLIKKDDSYEQQLKVAKKLAEELKNIRTEEEEIARIREKDRKEQEESRRQYAQYVADRAKEENDKDSQRQSQIVDMGKSLGKLDFSGFISKYGNYKVSNARSNLQDKMMQAQNEFMKTGDKEAFDSAMKEINEASGKLDASANKFQAASTVISTVTKIFSFFLDKWITRFTKGMDEIVATYEKTFTSQAAQAGISREEYFDKQREMQDSLNKQGLQNNIAISKVMGLTSDFVSKGITNMTDAIALGEQSAITSVLAPYFDTQSDAFISMSQFMGPKFAKVMTGMGANIAETVGQNRFIVKNMNSMVDDMQYMTLAARKSLMSEEEQRKLEQMTLSVEEGGAGMTLEQATKYYLGQRDVLTERYNALQNGSLQEKVMAADMSVTDAKSYNEASARYINSIYGSTDTTTPWGQLEFGAIKGATGDDWQGYNVNQENLVKILEGRGPTVQGSSPEETAEQTYEERISAFANDELQTTKEMYDIMAENASVEAAIAQEKWPDLVSAIRELLPGIASIFASWVGGKLLGFLGKKILGKGVEKVGTGLLSKAGTAIKGAFTTPGVSGVKGLLSSTGAKVLGGVGGLAWAGYDAYQGVKKADEWFADENGGKPATTGQKVSAGIGAALGGTGPSVFDENASAGDKLKSVASGAAKGALIGTMFGPIGTAVGGLVGGGLAAIGGENISKGLAKLGDGIKDAAGKVGNFVKDRWNDLKEMGSKVGETVSNMWQSTKSKFMEFLPKMGDSIMNAFQSFLDFLVELPNKIVTAIKWGIDTFLTAIQNMFSAIVNIPIFIGNAAIGLVNGLKNGLINLAPDWAKGTLKDWLPDDLPTIPYAEMKAMPELSSYATGTDYVETNGQLAYLHEGEAVLTKTAANVLRSQTESDISSAYGVTDALTNSSQLNKEGFNIIASAITDQTAKLIAKMDQILRAINSGARTTSYNQDFVSLRSGGF